MDKKRMRSKIVSLIILVTLLFPYSLSVGDQQVSLTAVNQTDYYLHIFMNAEPFLYIAPGRAVSLTAQGGALVEVRAFYAPGQGVKGTAVETFLLGGTSKDCNLDGSCTTSTEPSNPSSANWTITPDLLGGMMP